MQRTSAGGAGELRICQPPRDANRMSASAHNRLFFLMQVWRISIQFSVRSSGSSPYVPGPNLLALLPGEASSVARHDPTTALPDTLDSERGARFGCCAGGRRRAALRWGFSVVGSQVGAHTQARHGLAGRAQRSAKHRTKLSP